MAKVPMKRLFLCGLKQDRKRILELLQRTGVVEVDTRRLQDEDLNRMDVQQERQRFERNAQTAEQALAVLAQYAPDPKGGLLKSLEDAEVLPTAQYESRAASAEAELAAATEVLGLQQSIAEAKAELPKLESSLTGLGPWLSFDLPLNFAGTGRTAALIGSFPEDLTEEGLRAAIQAELNEEAKRAASEEAAAAQSEGTKPELPFLELQLISASKEQTAVFALCLKEDAACLERAFKKLNFARAPLSALVPAEEAKALSARMEACKAAIKTDAAAIAARAEKREAFRFTADYYRMRAEKYGVLQTLPQSAQAFFLEGYVPAACADKLLQQLSARFDLVAEVQEPDAAETVPVALKNGFFAQPVESVVESYSMPGPSEFDPSRLVSIFYYLMFGMMLSDAGYGLMLVCGTGILLLKVKNMKPGMKKMMKLFFYCGISTVFWGIMFGSFFGDAVNVIATTFFGRSDIALKPLWFEPVKEPMRLLVFAFALGIVHLFTGLGAKGVQYLKEGKYADAVYDVLFWYLFVGGGIVYLLTMDMITQMLGLSFTLPPVVGTVSAVLAGIGAVGVVLTGGRESRSWFKRILKGAYSAYGVTSYLSDILSYSRLLALGLATGVIAQVFNKMGSMLGATWYGVLVFILVFLIGHVLNLGINILGAYVHTNRLQFVEFFGKFYEGGGRKFEPFTEHTKYYKVKEEN